MDLFTFQVEGDVEEGGGFQTQEGILWFETPNSCHGLDDGFSHPLTKEKKSRLESKPISAGHFINHHFSTFTPNRHPQSVLANLF